MLEGDANAGISGDTGNGFPKFQQTRQKLFEGFVDRIAAARIGNKFDDGAGKTGDGADADVGGDFDGAEKSGAGGIGLRGVEGIFIERADGGDAEIARFGPGGELFGPGPPIGVARAGGAGLRSASIRRSRSRFGRPNQGARCWRQ